MTKFSALLCAGCLCAIAQPPMHVYTPDDGIRPLPRPIEKSEFEYTEEARLAHLEGNALLTFVVNEDGKVGEVHVTRPIGLGLDERAIDALKEWQFTPGWKDGKPVSVLMKMEAGFRLLSGRADWHLARAEFEAPKGVVRPVVIKSEFPDPSGPEEFAAASVSFDVDESGIPVNLHVEQLSDDKWEHEVISMVRAWRFQPGTENGHVVPVRCIFNFVRGRGTRSETASGAAVRPG